MLRWTDSESAGRVRCNSMILSGKRKSFVDDLSYERGIVSMRVALCYDLLRFILGSIRFVQFGRDLVSPPLWRCSIVIRSLLGSVCYFFAKLTRVRVVGSFISGAT